MFYIKVAQKNQIVKLEINEVFTDCFSCGKEIEVDSEMLSAILEDGDLSSRISCGCTEGEGVTPTLTRIK